MTARKTVAFTGMDSVEGEKLKGLFHDANRRVGDAWAMAPENVADMLIIDVDSLYGHMTWLKVHNSGRIIVALSSNEKAEADHLLLRPVTAGNLAELLARQAGTMVSAAPARAPEPAPAPHPEEPTPVARAPEPARPAAAQSSPSSADSITPSATPVAAAIAPEPLREPMLGDYLQAGALPGPVKLKLGDAGALVLDPQNRTYLGPTALKGFVPYAKAVIRRDEWVAVTPADLERMKGELGGAQPWLRLQWLAALYAGEGKLAPGFDPHQKFKLLKWPQIEREFPKHFRIATAMMKGPQLLTEVAEGSGATLAEVTDFVNASLATGFAEMEPLPATDAAPAQKGGLLGRLRR